MIIFIYRCVSNTVSKTAENSTNLGQNIVSRNSAWNIAKKNDLKIESSATSKQV